MADKHILQFCHGYEGPFLDIARQYAVLFKDTDYKVTTVYLTGAPSAEVEQGSASDQVLFLDYSGKQVRGLKLGAIADIRRLVARQRFAFCIAHRAKPTYVALFGTQLPVVSVHHAFGNFQRQSRKALAKLFARRLYLLGISNAVRDDLRQSLPGLPQARIQTLYNHIDLAVLQAEQSDRAEARTQLGLPQDAWIVGNVGRLHPDKDQTTLLRAFAEARPRLPDNSLLVILGQGRLESQLRQLAEQLGIAGQVRFLGQVPGARRYFKAFDLFALSSDREPFGMVLLEAMAACLPILASDCGGAPEGLGAPDRLFPFGDSAALAERLVSASQGPIEVNWDERLQGLFSDDAAREHLFALLKDWRLIP